MTNCSRRLQTWFLLFRQKRFTKILLAKWFPLFGQAIIYESFVYFVILEGSSSRCYLYLLHFYLTQVRLLPWLVIHSMVVERLDWCDPGVWGFTQPLDALPAFDRHLVDIATKQKSCCWCLNKTKPMLLILEQNKSSVVDQNKTRPILLPFQTSLLGETDLLRPSTLATQWLEELTSIQCV